MNPLIGKSTGLHKMQHRDGSGHCSHLTLDEIEIQCYIHPLHVRAVQITL